MRKVSERTFCRLKDWRRVAAHSDKLAQHDRATVTLAAIILYWERARSGLKNTGAAGCGTHRIQTETLPGGDTASGLRSAPAQPSSSPLPSG